MSSEAPRLADPDTAISAIIVVSLFSVAVVTFYVLRACRHTPALRRFKAPGLPTEQYGWRNPASIHVLAADESASTDDGDAGAARAVVDADPESDDDDGPPGRPEVL